MNKKTILTLAALGIIQANESIADDTVAQPVVSTSDPGIVAESLQVNVDTVRVLKMFSDLGALQFNSMNGTVAVDPATLPNFIIEKLVDSNEVDLDQSNDLFVLTDSFVNVLASNHVFSKLGSYDAIVANKKILDKLKENSTPVPREDQRVHSKASFIAGN